MLRVVGTCAGFSQLVFSVTGFLTSFPANEVLLKASSGNVAAYSDLSVHMQSVVANMSAAFATQELLPTSQELMDFLRIRSAGEGHDGGQTTKEPELDGYQASFVQLKRAASRNLRVPLKRAQAMTVDDARLVLNQMAEESQRKLDTEDVKCKSSSEKQHATTEGTRQDITEYNAQAAAARARILGIQTGISEFQDKLPRLNEALKLHKAKCAEDSSAFEAQIQLIRRDVSTLANVANMTNCDVHLGAALFQCGTAWHTGKYGKGHIMFAHHSLQRKVAQVKSPAAKRALQKVLRQAAGRHARSAKRKHYRSIRRHMRQAGKGRYGPPLLLTSSETQVTRASRLANTSAQQYRKQFRKCAIRQAPTCDTLQDKFLVMQASIADKADGMQESLTKLETMCGDTERNYEAQIQQMSTRFQDQQAALAEATKVVIEAEEQSRLAGQSLARLEEEARRMAGQCRVDLQSLAQDICSVKQIRQELYKMEAQRPFIQDCEVSAWLPEDCSATCGGGSQRMVRSVVVPASLGAACPPLVMVRRCNEQPCPVDCILGDWGGWSACSAQCGGGIMERVRLVHMQASGGGRPCDATSESTSCASQACDQDCKLSGWTRWSSCSKACDGGFQVRERHIATMAVGQGTCAPADSPARQQYLRCNGQLCQPTHGETLQCKANLDIVIILDGSGSMGEVGWAQTKKIGQALVRAFQTGVEGAQIAVLLYSGPRSWSAYEKCTQGTGSVDLLLDCNLIWVSHFTTNTVELAEHVGLLRWPKATTLTSAALASVEAELRTGRPTVQTVVIVITDGKAMNPRKTFQAARSLRKKARLMWVPVTRYASLADIKTWASKPVADNVMILHDFERLNEPANVNRIIAAACPELV